MIYAKTTRRGFHCVICFFCAIETILIFSDVIQEVTVTKLTKIQYNVRYGFYSTSANFQVCFTDMYLGF